VKKNRKISKDHCKIFINSCPSAILKKVGKHNQAFKHEICMVFLQLLKHANDVNYIFVVEICIGLKKLYRYLLKGSVQ